MIQIAGGIILGVLGLGILGMLLSMDWHAPTPAPAPRRDIPWYEWIGPAGLVGLFLLIGVWRLIGWWQGWQ
jgi:hypothetical protein